MANSPVTEDDFQISLARQPDFALGGAEVRPSAREIQFNGTAETVEPRVMQVLVALARREGEVVSRDELTRCCWEGRVVGEDAINRCLAKVRRLTERMQGVALETVPRVGYRLRRVAQSDIAAPDVAYRGPPPAWPLFVIGLGGLLVLVLLYAAYRTTRSQPPAAPTFAVLPFTSLNSGDDSHYVGKAIAASTVDALSRVSVPLASAAPVEAAADRSPADVARDLGADYVIYGNVRRDGDAVRAWARIDQAAGGVTIYTRAFQVPAADARLLPDLVAGGIGGAVPWTLPIIAREPDPAVQAGVFRAILSEDPRRGLEVIRESVRTAPDSAIAQLVFALRTFNIFQDYNTPEAERRALIAPARAAAAKALAALPDFGEAYLLHCALSATITPWDCEDRLRGGLATDPRSPWLPTYLANHLSEVGRLNEAGQLRSSTFAADSFQPIKAGYQIYHLELVGRTNRPETEPLMRAAQLYWRADPVFIENRFKGLAASGEWAEAERMLEDPISGPIVEPAGRDRPIRLILHALRTRDPEDVAAARAECGPDWLPRDIAVAACLNGLAALGDLDGAFALAERIYPDHRPRNAAEAEAFFLKRGGTGYTRAFLFGSAAAPLRQDRRFIGVAQRTGMLDYWRARRAPDFCALKQAPVCALLPPPRK